MQIGVFLAHTRDYFAHESLTVTSAVRQLTESVYKPSGGVRAPAQFATVSVETDSIRWTVDGTDPSTSAGHLATSGTYISLGGYNQIKQFKAHRVTGDATIKVSYAD